MEVLKSGTAKKPKTTTTECRCGCEFRFATSEARLQPDQRDGDAYVVKCPECRAENWVAATRFR